MLSLIKTLGVLSLYYSNLKKVFDEMVDQLRHNMMAVYPPALHTRPLQKFGTPPVAILVVQTAEHMAENMSTQVDNETRGLVGEWSEGKKGVNGGECSTSWTKMRWVSS